MGGWTKDHTSYDRFCYAFLRVKSGKFVPGLVQDDKPFTCWSDRTATKEPPATRVARIG